MCRESLLHQLQILGLAFRGNDVATELGSRQYFGPRTRKGHHHEVARVRMGADEPVAESQRLHAWMGTVLALARFAVLARNVEVRGGRPRARDSAVTRPLPLASASTFSSSV